MKNYSSAFPVILLLVIIVINSCRNNPGNTNITSREIVATEKLFDLTLTNSERDSMISTLETQLSDYKIIHSQLIDNSVPPALWFNPVPANVVYDEIQKPIDWKLPANVSLPADIKDISFYSVADISVLVRTRKISSVELTRFFLARLKKYGDTLHCVVTLTEDRALKMAQKADDELARGIYRGPLHGIPYGIKDLFAVGGKHGWVRLCCWIPNR